MAWSLTIISDTSVAKKVKSLPYSYLLGSSIRLTKQTICKIIRTFWEYLEIRDVLGHYWIIHKSFEKHS